MTSEQETLKKFAERLKVLREKTGLSQEYFAYTCGVDRSYMGRIERGEKNPSLIILTKIARGLDVKLKDLVDFED